MLSAAATMVSFDGRQQLTVDLEAAYDASRTSEVDDISLRMRTRYSSAHLLTSSSRHVTSDLLTVAVSDGRISVDIRTAADHKVCKGAITSKIKHAIKLTSPARLAQLLQPSLAFCFSLQPMTAYRPVVDGTSSLAAS